MNRTSLEDLLVTALPGLAPEQDGAASGRYRFRLASGDATPPQARAHVDGNWVVLQTATPRPSASGPIARLVAQSAWMGGVKWAGSDARGPTVLRAEVPLLTDTASARDWVVRQLRLVAAGLGTAGVAHEASASAAPRGGDECDPGSLAERCRSVGWPAAVKSDGEVWVCFESRSLARTITIARAAGGLRAAVALSVPAPLPRDRCSVQAAGIFLTRATNALRWARAWVHAGEEAITALGFECRLAAVDDDAPLGTAIDALTTACELFSGEAEALLASPTLARSYLEIAGGIRDDIAATGRSEATAAAHGNSSGASPAVAIT